MADVRQLFKSNLVFLANQLSITVDVLLYMVQDDIISFEEKELIECNKTGITRNSELLMILMKKDLNYCWKNIRTIFLETCNAHCVRKIEEKLNPVLNCEQNKEQIDGPMKNYGNHIILPSKWWPEIKRLVNAFHERKIENRLLVDKIKEHIISSDETQTMVICQTASVSGMGGVGKTMMAKWFGHKFEKEYDHIIWLDCGDGSLVSSFSNLARDLDLKHRHELNLYELAKKSFTKLENLKCLVIFDNAECYSGKEGVRNVLPKSGNFHCIITSRNREWGYENGGGKIHQYLLDVFDDDESFKFLKKYLKDVSYTPNQLHQLSKYLGNLPLALQIAIATLNSHKVKLEEYIQSFCKIDHTSNIISQQFDDYEKTIYNAMKISMKSIKSHENVYKELAYNILLSFGYLRPDDVPAAIFETIERVDIIKINEAMRLLEQYSLVTRKTKRGVANDVFSVHRLLQHVLRYDGRDLKTQVLTKILDMKGFLEYKLIPYAFADEDLQLKYPEIRALLIEQLKLTTFLREMKFQEAVELSKMIAISLQKSSSWYNNAMCLQYCENFAESERLLIKLYNETTQESLNVLENFFDEFGILKLEKEQIPMKSIIAAQLYLIHWTENNVFKAKQIAYQNSLILKNTDHSWRILLSSISAYSAFHFLCYEDIISFQAQEENYGQGKNVKLAYMDFPGTEEENDFIVLNEHINLQHVSNLTLYCSSLKKNIVLNLDSSVVLEKLNLKNITVNLDDGCNWKVKELTLRSEINNLLKKSSSGFPVTALPHTIEKLTVKYAEIDNYLLFSLPNLKYLQLVKTTSYSISNFSECNNLANIYLLSCTPLNLLFIPKQVKILKLWNTKIIGSNYRINNGITLDSLIVGGYYWPTIETVIVSEVKAKNYVIYYDFYNTADIEKVEWLIFGRNIKFLTIGKFFWQNDVHYKSWELSKLVDKKANYYCFTNKTGRGEALDTKTFFEKFNTF